MKNRYLLITCFYFITVVTLKAQITVPDPVFYLTFDKEDVTYESVSQQQGTLTGNAVKALDRFNNTGRAVRFEGKGSGIKYSGSSINSTQTTSFWIHISDPSAMPKGPKPFSDTDKRWEFYNWINTGNSAVLRGIARQKATIGFNRYIQKNATERVPWYLWGYSPAEFDEYGWYHIFVVQHPYYSRLTMFKPRGEKAYAYHWLAAQDFSTTKNLIIGALNSNTFGPEDSFDDFKIYNEALTDDQVSFLHTAEYPFAQFLRISNKTSGKYITVQNISTADEAPIIIHSGRGAGHNEWSLFEVGSNMYRVRNLHSDKLLVVKNASTAAGADIVQYRSMGAENEIWQLEYSNIDTKYFRIKNKNSGLYLMVKNNGTSDNDPLTQGNPGENSEYWTFEKSEPIQGNTELERGVYRLKNKNSGLYLDIQNRSIDKNANAVQFKYADNHTSTSNLWFVTPGYDNSFFVQNVVSGYELQTKGNYSPLENIIQSEKSSDSRNLWQFLPTDVNGEFELRNTYNYMYAVTQDASTTQNTPIVQYPTGESNNARWIPERYYFSDMAIPEGNYRIRNVNSEKMMVIKDASLENYAPAIQYSDGQANAVFEVYEAPFGYSTMNNSNSRKSMVIQDASLEESAQLIQYGATYPRANGQWLIERVPYMRSGTKFLAYAIKNLRSGLRLAVENQSKENGANIKQYFIDEQNLSALWLFEPISSVRSNSQSSTQSKIEEKTEEKELGIDVMLIDKILYAKYMCKSNTNVSFYICNISGKVLYESVKELHNGLNSVEINLSNINLTKHNTYIVIIQSATNKIQYNKKFIFQ